MTAREVDLVDIGGGNTGSISRCLERLGIPFRNVGAGKPPDGSRPLILPGVGAFGAVMDYLSEAGLDETIRSLARAGTPCLGICVGMQILFDTSTESPGVKGLGLLKGGVVRFDAPKVPQIGWNYITSPHSAWAPGYVYFVNSYYAQPAVDDHVLYRSNYAGAFCAAVQHDNITGFQFHPEKSSTFGHSLIERWVNSVN
jgi:glutamine amidotransferase